MNTWFVGTVNRFPREAHFSFIWSMQEFESESAARRYAKDALNEGLRVEAGAAGGTAGSSRSLARSRALGGVKRSCVCLKRPQQSTLY